MQTIQTILSYTVDHWDRITLIISALSGVLGGILELLGKSSASKWFGTVSVFDWARVLRWVKWIRDLSAARKQASVRAAMSAVLILACVGCGPAKAPTAIDAAKAAIVLTDDALSVAITTADDATATKLVELVPKVELAARAVRISADACPTLPDLAEVAVALKCDKCSVAIELAKKELACP
jgi:hypothetical protein